MESRKARRRHLNPKIKSALQTLAATLMAVGMAAWAVQLFGIAIGAIDGM